MRRLEASFFERISSEEFTTASSGKFVTPIRTVSLPVTQPAFWNTGIRPGAAEQPRSTRHRAWEQNTDALSKECIQSEADVLGLVWMLPWKRFQLILSSDPSKLDPSLCRNNILTVLWCINDARQQWDKGKYSRSISRVQLNADLALDSNCKWGACGPFLPWHSITTKLYNRCSQQFLSLYCGSIRFILL